MARAGGTTKGKGDALRGFFGIGIEGASSPMNFGNLARTAHGFGAAFVFTVDPAETIDAPPSDTAGSWSHMPWYSYGDIASLHLPDNCTLVGVELTEDAIELPSFRHPVAAAYLLGPEGGSLSHEAQAACAHIVQIPTRFCLNLATAGAVVMYDRAVTLGRFAPRPVRAGGPTEPAPEANHGWARYAGNEKRPTVRFRDRTGRAGKRLGEE